jgi:hypothetical protein
VVPDMAVCEYTFWKSAASKRAAMPAWVAVRATGLGHEQRKGSISLACRPEKAGRSSLFTTHTQPFVQ